jgi:hypothetical protein
VTGPATAGALIKVTGAPLALLADAPLLLVSSTLLRGVTVKETPSARNAPFGPSMRAGLQFVRGHSLLVTMARCVGAWQMCNQAAMVVQLLPLSRRARRHSLKFLQRAPICGAVLQTGGRRQPTIEHER